METQAALYRFEVGKLQGEVREARELKGEGRREEGKGKILAQEVLELKAKLKKLRAELDRKDTFNQHLRTKTQG